MSHKLLKLVRNLHLYLGAFTAPALLFFAFTGGAQVFGLHEAARGGDYRPPAWLAVMAQLHKKQNTAVPVHKIRTPGSAAAGAAAINEVPAPRARPGSANSALPLKIFSFVVALGLFTSTLTGLYVACRNARAVRLVSALLAAGVVVPVLLAVI